MSGRYLYIFFVCLFVIVAATLVADVAVVVVGLNKQQQTHNSLTKWRFRCVALFFAKKDNNDLQNTNKK